MHSLARMLGKSGMVVKRVEIDEEKEEQVLIIARKAGLISWLLSLMGIDSTFTLRVYSDRIESTEGSLSGQLKTVIPMVSVDTYTNGFTKPIQCFVLGVVLLIVTLFACFAVDSALCKIILFLAAVGSLYDYFAKRCLVLSFTTNGGNGILFLFKRSIIEGVNVDETLAERVADIVKRDYIVQTRK